MVEEVGENTEDVDEFNSIDSRRGLSRLGGLDDERCSSSSGDKSWELSFKD